MTYAEADRRDGAEFATFVKDAFARRGILF